MIGHRGHGSEVDLPCELEKREMTIRKVLSRVSSEIAPGRVRISSNSTRPYIESTPDQRNEYQAGSLSVGEECSLSLSQEKLFQRELTIPKLVNVRHGNIHRVETHP